MPVGLNLLDASGRLLIDTEKLYYGLVWSGHATLAPDQLYWETPRYEVTVTNSQFPVLYIAGEGTPTSIVRNGSVTTFHIDGYQGLNDETWLLYPPGISHPSNPAPECYVFDLMRANKEGFGMEVISPTGTPIFNSNMPPLNAAASVMPPPILPGTRGKPYRKYGYDQWSFDTSSPAIFGETCSISVASLGLSASRKYAYHIPWLRGAQTYGNGDNYNVFESVATGNGRVGFYWQLDRFSSIVMNPEGDEGIYGVHPNRVEVSLIDVTGFPFPFSY